MRVAGLASGMDIDMLVNDLMKAERMPLNKLQQDRQWLTWQRDAYREMNTSLSSFRNMFLDMRLSSTFNSKVVTSSQEHAVTATANTGVVDGSFSIEVNQLASQAINVSTTSITNDGESFDANASLESQAGALRGGFEPGTFTVTTYQNGKAIEETFTVDAEDSLNAVLRRISNSDLGVRAFYDQTSDRVFIERTETGNHNEAGFEIEFSGNSFLANTLQLDQSQEQGGQNALFTYNGIELTSKTNSYTLNGLTLNFHGETTGRANIGVQNDVEHAVEKITDFVNKYNEIVLTFNEKLSETRHRDYPPLTDEQREEMSESEIEMWEERAMSGLLRNDSTLRSVLSNMRLSVNAIIDTGNDDINSLATIGITPSKDYRDNGILEIDENKLREALQTDTDSVRRIFSNQDESGGIVDRLENNVRRAVRDLTDLAGSAGSTNETHSMGRRLGNLEDRISAFEQRLIQTESRYYRQFSVMEQAIQRANMQSMFLMQSFGGFTQQ